MSEISTLANDISSVKTLGPAPTSRFKQLLTWWNAREIHCLACNQIVLRQQMVHETCGQQACLEEMNRRMVW